MSYLFLAIGLALIVYGADWLVDGASAIARKAGVSEFVIGLTIVGFGTSMPELVVSLRGAFNGVSDIAVGNVVGSNIFNTLLILGITALVMPISITAKNRKYDIPLVLAATLLLICFGMSGSLFGLGEDRISRPVALLFILLFSAYMVYCFKSDVSEEEAGSAKDIKLVFAIGLVMAGLAGLIFGGRLFVDSAQTIARSLGVSDKFIAITVLAGGTSLPELATCIVAAIKKRGALALGNILGSNIFNILLILGCSALVSPLSLAGMNLIDMLALLVSAIALCVCSFTFDKGKLDRKEGAVMLVIFAAYYVWLFYFPG